MESSVAIVDWLENNPWGSVFEHPNNPDVFSQIALPQSLQMVLSLDRVLVERCLFRNDTFTPRTLVLLLRMSPWGNRVSGRSFLCNGCKGMYMWPAGLTLNDLTIGCWTKWLSYSQK